LKTIKTGCPSGQPVLFQRQQAKSDFGRLCVVESNPSISLEERTSNEIKKTDGCW
jgi:hypothetical protein